LRFTFVVAAYHPSTPHSSGFARLASGAFYAAIALGIFYEIINFWLEKPMIINGLIIIMTTSPYQNLSFPGLTGESRKALDARFRPAGMTGKQQW